MNEAFFFFFAIHPLSLFKTMAAFEFLIQAHVNIHIVNVGAQSCMVWMHVSLRVVLCFGT